MMSGSCSSNTVIQEQLSNYRSILQGSEKQAERATAGREKHGRKIQTMETGLTTYVIPGPGKQGEEPFKLLGHVVKQEPSHFDVSYTAFASAKVSGIVKQQILSGVAGAARNLPHSRQRKPVQMNSSSSVQG